MGIVENAIAQVTANVRATVDRLEAGGAYGSALANIPDRSISGGYQFGILDYSTGGAAVSLTTLSPTLNWNGDWLYVDRSSVGAPLATFQSQNSDQATFTLSPGRVIKMPFERVQIIYNVVNAASSPSTVSPQNGVVISENPLLRVWYGSGECPFEESQSPEGGDSPVPVGVVIAGSSTPSAYSATFFVPHGSYVIVSAAFTKNVATALLVPSLIIGGQLVAAGLVMNPDSIAYNQGGASAGGILVCKWKFRMPRGYFQVQIVANDLNSVAGSNVTYYGGTQPTVLVS